ncbi:MAG: sulfotransferase family 2 domain-containing protein [Anaerolineales bacterium]|jgi:hypothetical protein
MIITDRFVLLNFPKTGSSFVRSTLKTLHKKNLSVPERILSGLHLSDSPDFSELMMPALDVKSLYGELNQHGTYQQIPAEHKHKVIVSVTRNPFDRYVSAYLYGWWADHPPGPIEKVKAAFPDYPDLSFEEYYEMYHIFGREDRLMGIEPGIDLGVHTIHFIRFFFREPDRVLSTITDSYIEQKLYRRDMPAIHFLHQENLNEELHDFLLDMGYAADDIEFIKHAQRVNRSPTGKLVSDRQHLFTPHVVNKILTRDRLIISIFPEYENAYFENDS